MANFDKFNMRFFTSKPWPPLCLSVRLYMHTKNNSIYALFIGLLSLLLINACTPSESVAEKQARLATTYNLHIGASDPSTFFVVPYTRLDAKLPEAEIFPASASSLHESLTGVEDALMAYPPGFVSSQIEAIFIAGKMYFDDMSAGGTYQHSWIIVATTTDPAGEPNYDSALYGVHHELSSFIYHKSPAITRFWGALMPTNWQAKSNYKESLADNYQLIDYQNGFLNNYATTSVENDFNTYAEFVFARSDELIKLAKSYPLVAKKLRLFIDAYAKESPAMAQLLNNSPLAQVAAADEGGVITDVFQIDPSSIKPTVIYQQEKLREIVSSVDFKRIKDTWLSSYFLSLVLWNQHIELVSGETLRIMLPV